MRSVRACVPTQSVGQVVFRGTKRYRPRFFRGEAIQSSIAASTAAAEEVEWLLLPLPPPSSFQMVPTPWPSLIVPPTAPDRFTKKRSSFSLRVSPLTTISIVLLLSPGAKTSVPDLAV